MQTIEYDASGDVVEHGQVLVVDDDPKVRTLLRRCLETEGFGVSEAGDEPEALTLIKNQHFVLVTLDINLSQGDGFDVVRQVRQTSDVPIVMITGKDDVIDRVVGLELGADDYITKPFHVREVVARVKSILRRTHPHKGGTEPLDCGCIPPCTCNASPAGKHVVRFDGLTADLETLELRDRSNELSELTSADFKLLAAFLNHPKRVLSRDRLMDLTGGVEWTPLDRTIDNQVARLRKKIERDPTHPRLIKTVRGIGYMWAGDVERTASHVSLSSV